MKQQKSKTGNVLTP